MKIQIILRNTSPAEVKEIIGEMSEENYKELKIRIANGQIKMVEINNTFLNLSDIAIIRPMEETIAKKFRLPEKGETIKTSGEIQLGELKRIAEMDKIFDYLKGKGLFGKKNMAKHLKKLN